MAQNDLLRRLLDAGVNFTSLTQRRAEAIVRDLVRAGEVQRDQTQQYVQELVDRSRENSERLFEQVRREIRSQLRILGLATKSDVARLERRVESAAGSSG